MSSAGSKVVCGVGMAGKPRVPVSVLASFGCNAIRTWGVDQLAPDLLDECAAAGVAIYAGIWVHDAAPASLSQLTPAILEHPSIVAWIVGNEVETRCCLADALSAVERTAAAVKSVDAKRRPITTALAEIGDDKAARVRTSCPSIDFVSINTYGGVHSLRQRLNKQGYTGAFMVTEFGMLGPWETPCEQSSSEKALFTAQAYSSLFDADASAGGATCVGSFAFFGGWKWETSPTWFSMALPLQSDERPHIVADSLLVLGARWRGYPASPDKGGIVSLLGSAGAAFLERIEVAGHSPDAPLHCKRGDMLNTRVLATFAPGTDERSLGMVIEWRLLPAACPGGAPPVAAMASICAVRPTDCMSASVQAPSACGDYYLYAFVSYGRCMCPAGLSTVVRKLRVE